VRPVASSEPLICPTCARTFAIDERFCPDCKMPLVYAGVTGVDQPVTGANEKARKIKPQYAEGELRRVAGAQNQAEAEFIQGMLLEEGIPSVTRRSAGFDVPDFLAAGPRDVLVPESGAAPAREVLRVALIVLAGVLVVALVAWLGTEVLG
jgi:uncharacterized protein YbaR (Trm112 family)